MSRKGVESIIGRPIADAAYIDLLEKAVEAKDGVIMREREALRRIVKLHSLDNASRRCRACGTGHGCSTGYIAREGLAVDDATALTDRTEGTS